MKFFRNLFDGRSNDEEFRKDVQTRILIRELASLEERYITLILNNHIKEYLPPDLPYGKEADIISFYRGKLEIRFQIWFRVFNHIYPNSNLNAVTNDHIDFIDKLLDQVGIGYRSPVDDLRSKYDDFSYEINQIITKFKANEDERVYGPERQRLAQEAYVQQLRILAINKLKVRHNTPGPFDEEVIQAMMSLIQNKES